MSLKKNTIANYIGQGYTILLAVVILPLYLKRLGAEAYGLVGFFLVMQAWLNLLDMGLTPTLAREVARIRGGACDFAELRRLLRSLEVVFLILSVVIGLGIVIGSNWAAHNWLKVETLTYSDVAYCIALMGIMVGIRWFAALYRSGIRGMECLVWLNGTNMLIETLRFVGGLALLHWISREPIHFFEYQLSIGIIELMFMGVKFYSLLPGKGGHFGFSWESIRGILPFASGIAYLAFIWVLLTQLDKLLLSHLLPLKEYGYFALVAIVANGVLQISAPISQALLPRMTYLLAQGKEQEMLRLYRKATQFIAVIMFPLAGMVAIFSKELLFAWTGDKAAAEWAGPVLFWYVLGNGILSMGAFQYYLQFAHGKLKLHVIFNTFSGIISAPIVVFAAFYYGAMGVAVVWFWLRVIIFIIWPPIVHHNLAPGIHSKWLFKDIAPIFATTAILLVLISRIKIPFESLNRIEVFTSLLGIGLIVLMMNAFASGECRGILTGAVLKIRS